MRASASLLALILCALHTGAAATPRTQPVTLTGEERAHLAQLACDTPPISIVARRRTDPPLLDYAEIECTAHAQYEGHAISHFVQCSRADAYTLWRCDQPMSTIRIEVSEHEVVVRYSYLEPEDVLDAISYLQSGPTKDGVQVDPHWLIPLTWVGRMEGGIQIQAGDYGILLRIHEGAASRFDIEQISRCEEDTCHSLKP